MYLLFDLVCLLAGAKGSEQDVRFGQHMKRVDATQGIEVTCPDACRS